MKKMITLFISAVLMFVCCGVTAFADGDFDYYGGPEEFARVRVSHLAVNNPDFPLYSALDEDGNMIYLYAEPNEEIVLSGLQEDFDQYGLDMCDPRDFVQCVDMIRFPYAIKSYLDNYVIGTHKKQPHHIYVEVVGQDVKIHYDTGTDAAELDAVRACIAEQYFDESVIEFCPENLITDVYAISELIAQFTQDQNFDSEDYCATVQVSIDGYRVVVCFMYAMDGDAARPLYNAFMTAYNIDRSKVTVTGVNEDSGEKQIRLRGNIDGDDDVTCIDAQLVLRNALELMLDSGTEPIDGADIDGDGAVTSLDAQYILLYYLNNTVIEKPVMWKDIIP